MGLFLIQVMQPYSQCQQQAQLDEPAAGAASTTDVCSCAYVCCVCVFAVELQVELQVGLRCANACWVGVGGLGAGVGALQCPIGSAEAFGRAITSLHLLHLLTNCSQCFYY